MKWIFLNVEGDIYHIRKQLVTQNFTRTRTDNVFSCINKYLHTFLPCESLMYASFSNEIINFTPVNPVLASFLFHIKESHCYIKFFTVWCLAQQQHLRIHATRRTVLANEPVLYLWHQLTGFTKHSCITSTLAVFLNIQVRVGFAAQFWGYKSCFIKHSVDIFTDCQKQHLRFLLLHKNWSGNSGFRVIIISIGHHI